MKDFSVKHYFERLIAEFGRGWNHFWYTPSNPLPLSLIRVATGLIALYFVLTYTADITYFFAQDGLLPVELTEQPQYLPDGQVYNPATLSYLSHLNTARELLVAHWLGVAVFSALYNWPFQSHHCGPRLDCDFVLYSPRTAADFRN